MQTLEQLREQDRRMATAAGPTGLGGWLILPMLGMIATPVIGVIGLRDYFPLLVGNAGLSGLQATLVWFEVITNVAIQLLAPPLLLMFFFQKKRTFPSLFVGWALANLIFVLLDLVLAYNAFRDYYDSPGVVFWDQATTQSISRAVIFAAIWVPYMLNSARVRNTFVK